MLSVSYQPQKGNSKKLKRLWLWNGISDTLVEFCYPVQNRFLLRNARLPDLARLSNRNNSLQFFKFRFQFQKMDMRECLSLLVAVLLWRTFTKHRHWEGYCTVPPPVSESFLPRHNRKCVFLRLCLAEVMSLSLPVCLSLKWDQWKVL